VLAVILLLKLIAILLFLMKRRQNSMSKEHDIDMDIDMPSNGNDGSIFDNEITLRTTDAIISGFVSLDGDSEEEF
jgi:hypothetical protein